MKIFLPLFIFISTASYSQSADFIQLKKHKHVINTYFSGGNISFTATSGTYFDGLINGIKDDTLYLQQFVVRYVPTTLGTYIIDTVGSYHYKYHYNQIKAIGKTEKKNFNWRGSGASLMGGAALITIGSGLVYAFDRKKFSAPLLYTAMGLGGLGYLISKAGTGGMIIGKKYHLEYMKMSK